MVDSDIQHHVAVQDISLGENFMFPSISLLFFQWRGAKSIAKLDGDMSSFPPTRSASESVNEEDK